jgi:hypothetical protein
MSIEKIGLTLYDFLGYLFPGYVFVLTCSVVESTFLTTDLLTLSTISDEFLTFTIVAYFSGHLIHAVGSLLKDLFYKWFSTKALRLSRPLFDHVRETVQEAYAISLAPEDKLDTLETLLLAESYVQASGGLSQLDVLAVREGFHKASMVAFGFLSAVLLLSLLVGGAKMQTYPDTYTHLSWSGTILFSIVTIVATLLFRGRFIFYNRAKINNTLLSFLAFHEKDLLKKKE